MPNPTPLVLSPALPSELLSYILKHQGYPTTLIVCQQRATFLTSLLCCVPNGLPQQLNPNLQPSQNCLEEELESTQLASDGDEYGHSDRGIGSEGRAIPKQQSHCHLLIPTLRQIAVSRTIKLIYLSSVSHLRAYLSVSQTPALDSNKQDHTTNPCPTSTTSETKRPLLVIYGLISSHRHTSEWSVQGLGASLATLVDSAAINSQRVVLFEELTYDCFDRSGEQWGLGEERSKRRDYGRQMWEERVPILYGNARKGGMDAEGGWSGRTVELGRVLARWFRFGRSEWDSDE